MPRYNEYGSYRFVVTFKKLYNDYCVVLVFLEHFWIRFSLTESFPQSKKEENKDALSFTAFEEISHHWTSYSLV